MFYFVRLLIVRYCRLVDEITAIGLALLVRCFRMLSSRRSINLPHGRSLEFSRGRGVLKRQNFSSKV